MGKQTVVLGSYKALDFETITCSNSTAQGLNSTNTALASRLIFTVATNTAHFRHDGTDPTLTTGVVLQTGTVYDWQGLDHSELSNLKFQRSTGTATISVQAYKIQHATG